MDDWTNYLRSLPMSELVAKAGNGLGNQARKNPAVPVVKLFADVAGKCESCGQETFDWWWYSGATGACGCHSCYESAGAAG